MKLSKREKNSYIVGFLLNILLIIVFIFFGFKQYGEYKVINKEKEKTISIIKEKEVLQNKGIDYLTFIDNVKKNKELNKNLLLKVTREKYKSDFVNNGTISYKDFLLKKTEEVKSMYDPGEEILPTLNKIMPTYNQVNVKGIDYDYITEYSFVNYLEKLSYFFDLEMGWTANNIDIKELKRDLGTNEDIKPENIYFIDYNFTVKGEEGKIMNFIHFFENVGSIETTGDNKIILYSDDFIKNQDSFPKLYTLYEDKNETDDEYNIYENIFGEIIEITFNGYPDEDNNPFKYVNGYTFADYIKEYKSEVEFSMDIGIRFYFKGLPEEEIKDFIESFISDYNDIKSRIKEDIDKINSSRSENYSLKNDVLFDRLTSLYQKLDKITKDVNNINANIDSYYNFEKVYKEIYDHIELLRSIKDSFESL